MLNIDIVCIGKIKEKFFKEAIAEYSKRLSKYCNLKFIELPDEKLPSKLNTNIINEIKNKECSKMLYYIYINSYIIFLDL